MGKVKTYVGNWLGMVMTPLTNQQPAVEINNAFRQFYIKRVIWTITIEDKTNFLLVPLEQATDVYYELQIFQIGTGAQPVGKSFNPVGAPPPCSCHASKSIQNWAI